VDKFVDAACKIGARKRDCWEFIGLTRNWTLRNGLYETMGWVNHQ